MRNQNNTSWIIASTPGLRMPLTGEAEKMLRRTACSSTITKLWFLHLWVEITLAKTSRLSSERRTSSWCFASPHSSSKPAGREKSTSSVNHEPRNTERSHWHFLYFCRAVSIVEDFPQGWLQSTLLYPDVHPYRQSGNTLLLGLCEVA